MNESNLSDVALAELLTLNMKVDSRGNTAYRNQLDQVHRTHGPAMVFSNGTKRWYQNGLLHRTDGHAIVWANGDQEWWLGGYYMSQREFDHRIKLEKVY